MKIGNFDMEVLSPNGELIEIENYILRGWPEKNNNPTRQQRLVMDPN